MLLQTTSIWQHDSQPKAFGRPGAVQSHVLVIEDEFLIAKYIGCLAEDAGATSIAYAETEQGLCRLHLTAGLNSYFSDVKLLVGTGPAAVATILAQLGPLPVIFMTGSPEECKPCEPPSIIMTKPIDTEEFGREFRRLLKPG